MFFPAADHMITPANSPFHCPLLLFQSRTVAPLLVVPFIALKPQHSHSDSEIYWERHSPWSVKLLLEQIPQHLIHLLECRPSLRQ